LGGQRLYPLTGFGQNYVSVLKEAFEILLLECPCMRFCYNDVESAAEREYRMGNTVEGLVEYGH
jgi:hypothetical protein